MTALLSQPIFAGYHSLRQFTVDEYHRMIDADILNEADKVELLEGYVVLKMPRNPAHDGTLQRVARQLWRVLPAGWDLRSQSAVTLSDSEPEPDYAIVRGDDRSYLNRHPGPADVGLIVEIANTSLDRDRNDKTRIYARAGIACYWVVNLPDQCVEVFTDPSGPTPAPAFAQHHKHAPGDSIPLVLDGTSVGAVAVSDLLP